MLWDVNFSEIKGNIKIKKVIFWFILVLISALLIETPFRVFNYWGARQFERAQAALTVASENDLHKYYDVRTIVDQFPSDFLGRTVTDIINLNNGGYTEYPDFSLFTERKPYFMFRLNNMGFRGPDSHMYKEKGEIRVFVVGGSTSFSFFMDEDHSIHRQLEEFLNQKNTNPDKHYKVYSAGVPAMNTFGELEVVRQFVLPYKPDIIVAINGYNDAVIDQIPIRDGNLLYKFYRYLASTPIKHWVRRSAALKLLADKASLLVRARVKFYKEVGALAPEEVAKVYAANMTEMRKIIENNGSKLIVYRQPTLLASGGKSLTIAERRVRDWWASGHELFYKNFIEAYPLLDRYLIEHNFDYINGQDLGKFGLWGGKIEPQEAVVLKEESAKKIPLEEIIISNNGNNPRSGLLKVKKEGGKRELSIPFKMLCDKSVLTLIYNGTSLLNCELVSGRTLLDHALNPTSWDIGYENVAYPSMGDELVLYFKLPASIETASFSFFISNYRDRNSSKIKVAVSADGDNYKAFPEETIPYGSHIEVNYAWQPQQNSRELFIKTRLSRKDNFIGIDTMNLIMRGTQTVKFWNPEDETLEFVNGTDSAINIEASRTAGGDPLFIDNAHPNLAGYRMIADEIAQYILKRSW